MSAQLLSDGRRLAIHTITTRAWDIETAIDRYAAHSAAGITVWRQWLDGRDPFRVGARIREAGLTAVSLCRGGFFPAATAVGRQRALDENRRAIDEAAALGAPLIALVCGADPQIPLADARRQIAESIAALAPYAADRGVRLGIEPLHPMYADSRSAISTLKQANDLCAQIDSPAVGVALDVYHVWWDPDLEAEIRRCGAGGWLAAFHVCDWRTPTEDLLNDRGLMGAGCIPIRQIRGWVEEAGFTGFIEVEIFSERLWEQDPESYLADIIHAYYAHV